MTSRVDLASLVHAHQAGIWRYLRVLGCEATAAEDLTQETFLVVLERPFEDYGPAATAAYLRKVARNLFISSMRRTNRAVSLEGAFLKDLDQIDEEWTRWAGADNGELYLEALERCLESLGERARHALDLCYRDEKSRQEIASDLGMTADGAKNLLQRAKQSLRACIESKLG